MMVFTNITAFKLFNDGKHHHYCFFIFIFVSLSWQKPTLITYKRIKDGKY